LAVGDAVIILKVNSVLAMKTRFPFPKNIYDQFNMGIWFGGYFISTVGCDEKKTTLHSATRLKGQRTNEVWVIINIPRREARGYLLRSLIIG
jgi:hypothetical protein